MRSHKGTPGGRHHPILLLFVLALFVASCSTPLTTREKGAIAGGAIGAGAGAAIGSASGHTGTGALIGDAMQAHEQQQAPPPPPATPPPPPPPVSVAPPPPPPPVSVAPPPPPVVVAAPPPPHVSIDIRIGQRPALAVVPGTSVYYAPHVSYNYFAYGGRFYVYQNDAWLSARAYNGPWTVIAFERVPRPILGVPVKYYKAPPGHWKHKHGPPPWAHAKGHAKQKGYHD